MKKLFCIAVVAAALPLSAFAANPSDVCGPSSPAAGAMQSGNDTPNTIVISSDGQTVGGKYPIVGSVTIASQKSAGESLACPNQSFTIATVGSSSSAVKIPFSDIPTSNQCGTGNHVYLNVSDNGGIINGLAPKGFPSKNPVYYVMINCW